MTTLSAERKLGEPALNPGDEAYFDAASEHRLLIKSCNACHEKHHYPRAICPFCWSTDLEWVDTLGTGVIYTFSVTRKGTPTPYCIAYVTLDEGPTIMTNIVDVDLDTIRIGQKVEAVFKTTDGNVTIPMFTLAS